MNRRQFVGLAAAAASTAGCLGSAALPGSGTGTTTRDADVPEWTRSTDCDGMHDSVIEAKWVTDSLREAYAPIRFSSLTPAEQSLLRTVVAEGGVGTCDPSPAFERFVRRVGEHRREQADGGDGPSVVHLAYEGRYYGLYVEKTDMVFSG